MKTAFRFRQISSELFRVIHRPYTDVTFIGKNKKRRIVSMVVDTGADYSLLPRKDASLLGIDLAKDCTLYTTYGVGGSQTVYLYMNMKVELDTLKLTIPVGFLDSNDIPPLLGRHGFFEVMKACFENHVVYFEK
ncbi:retropepsin-like domain-containing protein [Candidatus Roizmanbacteria bacterium]|nr:retropepsin-like domain-containing protein [Candidatus Roizmanbacteria bacterium]